MNPININDEATRRDGLRPTGDARANLNVAPQTAKANLIPHSNAESKAQTAFDPQKFLFVAPKRFEELKVGDLFRAPSRTLTETHTSEFQAISGDNNPRHYNAEYCKSLGMKGMLVQPLQVLALTAPGATLFTHYVLETLVGFTETSCKFLVDSFAGDTLYPALKIAELSKEKEHGFVTMAISIHNQRGELVLSGHERFTLRLSVH
jgi:acyl dehydratase